MHGGERLDGLSVFADRALRHWHPRLLGKRHMKALDLKQLLFNASRMIIIRGAKKYRKTAKLCYNNPLARCAYNAVTDVILYIQTDVPLATSPAIRKESSEQITCHRSKENLTVPRMSSNKHPQANHLAAQHSRRQLPARHGLHATSPRHIYG